MTSLYPSLNIWSDGVCFYVPLFLFNLINNNIAEKCVFYVRILSGTKNAVCRALSSSLHLLFHLAPNSILASMWKLIESGKIAI